MRQFTAPIAFAACVLAFGQTSALAQSDVILGELVAPRVYERANGIAALSFGTTSCNAGDRVLEWRALPENRHPVIGLNMYMLRDGRLTQIGQSWVKHGFVALQQNICRFGCQMNPSGAGLGVGCSDPYGPGNNQGPNLGSRRLINAFTGAYDGAAAKQELDSFRPATPVDHGLQVAEVDLGVPGARYFIEGHYIAPDDARAGNGFNNVSHAEVKVTRDGAGNINIEMVNPGTEVTVREMPAIRAWPYADFSTHDGLPDDGRIIVGSRVIRLNRTSYRYEYAVYNMNSNKGVASFSVPAGAANPTNIGMSGVQSHGEPFSNELWAGRVEGGRVMWSTSTAQQSENANAIRWGTSFNFWFETTTPPATSDANLGYFRTSPGAPSFSAKVQAPKN